VSNAEDASQMMSVKYSSFADLLIRDEICDVNVRQNVVGEDLCKISWEV